MHRANGRWRALVKDRLCVSSDEILPNAHETGPRSPQVRRQPSLVAGVGFEPTTFRL
jgi:hypothetical protein